jgi:uncharacterized protein
MAQEQNLGAQEQITKKVFGLETATEFLGFWRTAMANKWDERKKAQEDEYFVKKEQEQLAKLRAKHEAETKSAAKEASSMRCPKCGEPLKERSFQKITIDQCTACHGIWLDAGELEQVAEKESGGWLGKFWQKNG